MKKEKAMELMESFPELTDEDRRAIRATLKPYVIVDTNHNAYCTHCEQRFTYKDTARHRANTVCPLCGVSATVIFNYHTFRGSVVEATNNIVIFRDSPETDYLYVSCVRARLFFNSYELMPRISLVETQRYIFTGKSAVRYGKDYEYTFEESTTGHFNYYNKHYKDEWTPRTKYTEPNFDNGYNYGYDVIYKCNLNNTCMAHSALNLYSGKSPFLYLKFYSKHKGAERLLKCGMGDIVKRCVESVYSTPEIDWSQNEPHRMLGVSKNVMRAIRAGRISLYDYRCIVEVFPYIENLDTLISYNNIINNQYGSLDMVCNYTRSDRLTILKYLKRHSINLCDYHDYLRMANSINYNTKDEQVKFPRDFYKMHDRLEEIRQALENEKKAQKLAESRKKFEEQYKNRKKLEFSFGDYIIRQPATIDEIVAEGQALSHCVGGYAERHASGTLTIMFLRKKSEPEKPYYTIEVSNRNRIVQCRGYKNNCVYSGGEEKPQEIIDLEKQYQDYLDTLKKPKKSKIKIAVSA